MTTVSGVDRVVSALRSSAARLIALFAPSGYGKTERARLFGANFDTHVYRALASSDSSREVVHEVREALAGVALDAAILVTIDDAHCADDAMLAELVAELLDLPRRRLRVLLCSRREPRFAMTRFADSAAVAVFRRSELALGINDRQLAVFAESEISTDELTQTLCISNGWPEITLYFVRLFQERRLYDAMRNYTSIAWRDLLDWVEERVVRPLPEHVRTALFLAAAVSDARPEDFAAIAPDADVALFRDYQLADIGTADEIRLLPVLRHYCYARHPQQLRDAATAFARRVETAEPLRAARAYINVRLLDEAQRIVGALDHPTVMSLGEYAYPGASLELFSKAPPYRLYPRLWYGLVTARRAVVGSEVLADEAEELLESRALDGRWAERLRAIAAILSFECARPERALEYMHQLQTAVGADDPIAVFVALVDDFFAGRYLSAVDRWHRNGASLVNMPAWYGWIGLYYARALGYLGEYGRAKRAIELMISLGQTTPALAAEAALDGAFFSWIMSEEDVHVEYRSEAARLARYYDVPAYWVTVAALYGIAPTRAHTPTTASVRASLVLASLLPAEMADDVARAGVARADRLQALSLQVAARVVLAETETGAQAQRLFEEATELAQRSESEFLVRSVEAVRTDDAAGLFAAVRRTGRAPRTAETEGDARVHDIFVDATDLSIARHGRPLRVSERVRELLVFLATARTPVRRDVLVDQLWPDLDGDAAASALKMCVHRARTQTGSPDAVVVSGGTYALGPAAESDYFEILRAAHASYAVPFDADVRARLRTLFERLLRGLSSGAQPWPWMAPASRALGDAAISIGERIVADLRAGKNLQQAVAVARQLIEVRPEMELPRILLIQLHLDMGNTLMARQEYDEFLKLCEDRYTKPSDALRRMIAG